MLKRFVLLKEYVRIVLLKNTGLKAPDLSHHEWRTLEGVTHLLEVAIFPTRTEIVGFIFKVDDAEQCLFKGHSRVELH